MMIEGRSTVSIGLQVATNLWINWAWIALDHRDEAIAMRDRDGPPAANPELQASMVSILASAVAIDGFTTAMSEAGSQPNASGSWGRATYVWETLRLNFDVGSKTQTWPIQLKELWVLRSHRVEGGLAHPKNVFGSLVVIPPGQAVSHARSTYTAETSSRAARLLGEVVTTCNEDALRLGASAELRQAVFDVRTYVAEFAEGTGITQAS